MTLYIEKLQIIMFTAIKLANIIWKNKKRKYTMSDHQFDRLAVFSIWSHVHED